MAQRPVHSTNLSDLDVACHAARAEAHARLARNVHDDLGGDLAAIKMALAVLIKRIPAGTAPLLEQAAYVDRLVDRAIDTMHGLSDDLPPLETGQSLSEALALDAAEFTRLSGIPCGVNGKIERNVETGLQPEMVNSLLRVAREALVNIGKHASAAHASMRLSSIAGGIRLEIEDDGKGIRDACRLKPDAYGIRSMQERARFAGGSLSVNPVRPHGTLIRVDIPYK